MVVVMFGVKDDNRGSTKDKTQQWSPRTNNAKHANFKKAIKMWHFWSIRFACFDLNSCFLHVTVTRFTLDW